MINVYKVICTTTDYNKKYVNFHFHYEVPFLVSI